MSVVEKIISPVVQELGDGFQVRRALPAPLQRAVGPFVFLDQLGPVTLQSGRGIDVRPHPHIGLATVTWLFAGEIMHRDSLGNVQAIRPGEVNWMTAGRGIVHSERTAPEERSRESALYGLQCWVALPKADEEIAPDFTHCKAHELPVLETDGVHATLIAGSFRGLQAPVPTRSALFYLQLLCKPDARTAIPAEYTERAIYIVEGEVSIDHEGVFGAGQLIILTSAREVVIKAGAAGAILMLLGGEPLDGHRHMVWNFVSSSKERIEQAKTDWLDQRFASVPDETEFIPLPQTLR